MAKSKTSFKPGTSGNPKGRPPKSRALTEILMAAGKKKVTGIDGKSVERRKLLAEMVWTGATEGRVIFQTIENDILTLRTVTFKGEEWMEFVKWLFDQCDGKLSISMKLEEESEAPVIDPNAAQGPVFYLPENGRDVKPDDRTADDN